MQRRPGPRFFGPNVPTDMGGKHRPMVPGLGDLPAFDPSDPSTWPTRNTRVFGAGGGVSPIPGPAGSGFAPSQLPQYPFNVYSNLAIPVQANQPALSDDPNRCFLLVQNLDPATTLLVSFGQQATAQIALQLLAGVGFVWDMDVPNNSMYVSTLGVVTVLPIGMVGQRTWR